MASKCHNKEIQTLQEPYGALVLHTASICDRGGDLIINSLSHTPPPPSLSLTCLDDKKKDIKATECQQISEMWQGIKCVAESAPQSIKSNSQLEGNPV